jgi:hypothetical protein
VVEDFHSIHEALVLPNVQYCQTHTHMERNAKDEE